MHSIVIQGAMLILIGSVIICGCNAESRQIKTADAAIPAADRGACIPFGAGAPSVWKGDPALDGTPPVAELRTPLPTCAPDMTPTPGPTPTPVLWPTRESVLSAGADVATAPQNLSLSPADETLRGVAIGPRQAAVVWASSGGDNVTFGAPSGYQTHAARDLLTKGRGTPAAVALSPGGRIHLAADGWYAYADGPNATWSAPRAVISGTSPQLVVDGRGYARLFVLSGADLVISAQQPDGGWSAPATISSGVTHYDVILAGNSLVIAAVSQGDVTAYREQEGTFTAVASHGSGSAQSTTFSHRRGVTMVAIADADRVVFGRSLDQGRQWAFCSGLALPGIADVFAFASDAGAYVGLFEHQGYIAIATIDWPAEQPCSIYPSSPQTPPPGLFYTAARQGHFAAEVHETAGFLAFEGGAPRDIFAADISTRVLSGRGAGVGSMNQGAP